MHLQFKSLLMRMVELRKLLITNFILLMKVEVMGLSLIYLISSRKMRDLQDKEVTNNQAITTVDNNLDTKVVQ